MLTQFYYVTTGIFLVNYFNTMTPDTLAPCIHQIISNHNIDYAVQINKGFQLQTPFQLWEMINNANIFLFFKDFMYKHHFSSEKW